jgi:hypothetical protein
VSLAPTPRLRFVRRPVSTPDPTVEYGVTVTGERVLQQWWAADVPSYMRGSEGEWRDVDTADE